MRLVFGALPSDLGHAVMRQIARLAIPGIAVGLVAFVAFGRALERFVFGVDTRSIPVLAAAGLLMMLVLLAGTFPSVLRAMRVDLKRHL